MWLLLPRRRRVVLVVAVAMVAQRQINALCAALFITFGGSLPFFLLVSCETFDTTCETCIRRPRRGCFFFFFFFYGRAL